MADSVDAGLAARLDRIKLLTEELAHVQRDSETARRLVATIKREVELTREALASVDTHLTKPR